MNAALQAISTVYPEAFRKGGKGKGINSVARTVIDKIENDQTSPTHEDMYAMQNALCRQAWDSNIQFIKGHQDDPALLFEGLHSDIGLELIELSTNTYRAADQAFETSHKEKEWCLRAHIPDKQDSVTMKMCLDAVLKQPDNREVEREETISGTKKKVKVDLQILTVLEDFPEVLPVLIKRNTDTDGNIIRTPVKGIATVQLSEKSAKTHEYTLTACIVHHGHNPYGGHYTAYAKKKERWHHYDDQIVTALGDLEALEAMEQGCIFFYKRRA